MTVYVILPNAQNGVFLALPSEVGTTDEEAIAVSKREAPIERAAEIERRMRDLALALWSRELSSTSRH